MARIHSALKGGVAQVSLDALEEDIGPLIGIEMTERDGAIAGTHRWLLEVNAQTAEGRFRVGRTLTIGPDWPGGPGGAAAQPPGSRSARLVAVALCPGARGWSVTATAFDFTGNVKVDADAEIFISRAEGKVAIGLTSPGVFPVNASGTGRACARVRTAQLTAGVGFIVWAPEEPFRIRATIINMDFANPGNIVFVGDGDVNNPGVVTAANGFPLRPGDRFSVDHNRIMGVIAAQNTPVATLIEEG